MLQLLAQTVEDYDLDSISPEDLENTLNNSAAATGVLAAFGSFMIVFVLIALAAAAYTIWMLIDSILRKDEEYPNGSGKVMWILLIVFLGLIPAIIYHVTVKKKIPRGGSNTPTPPPAPPTDQAPKA